MAGRFREVAGFSGSAAVVLTLGSSALANSGIQLPLSQYQGGTEQATLVNNGNFTNRGTPDINGDYPDPPSWTRAGNQIFVAPTLNPPTNATATSPYSAQIRFDTNNPSNSYTQNAPAMSANGNYVLSAYVWNWGRYDTSGGGQGDLATVKLVDSGNTLNNVSMTLEGQGSDGQPSSSGRFMYIMVNQSFVASWSGSPVQIQAIGELGSIPGAVPTVWAQFDNIGFTPAEAFSAEKWAGASSGNWTDSTKWLNGLVPNAAGDVASFLSGPAVTVGVAGTVTVGQLNISNTSSYTINGAGTINMAVTTDGQNNMQGTPEISVLSGNHTISAHVVFDSTSHLAHNQPYQGILNAASGSTLTLTNMTASGVKMFKTGAGTARVNNATADSVTVNAGKLAVLPNGGNSGVSYMNSVSVDATAALDLNDNDLVVTYGTNPNSFLSVRALVFAGFRQAPDPSATGIVSGTAQNDNGKEILALFDNALLNSPDWPPGSGHTIDANSVVGKYTYFGDLNLDGQVTGDDYPAIDSNLNTTPPPGIAWVSGDANLDGIVTGDDYAVIDSNLGNGVGNPLSSAGAVAIPEPSVGLVALSLGAMVGRRRRRVK